MAFDVEQWLGELQKAGSLTAEELTGLKASLGKPGVVKYLEESQLRQAEFSRRMNELSDKEKATLALQQQLVAWKDDAEKKLKDAGLSVSQERQERAKIEAAFKTVCEQNGIDPASVGVTPPANPPNPNPNPTVNPTNPNPQNPEFLTRKEWEEQQKVMAAQYPLLPAMLQDLSLQHQQLFGKPLENSTALVKKAMEAGKPLNQVWEEEFKVAERRTQLQEEQVQKRIDAAVAERDAKVRSELNLPPPPRPEAHSPVLAQYTPPANPQTGQPEVSAVQAATKAWMDHKYAPGANQ